MEKANPKDQPEFPTPSPPSKEDLRDAGQLISHFLMAWKNYALYPENHESTTKSLENLVAVFGNFFAKHGDLRLIVEKDHLLYNSEIIHTVSRKPASEDIITLLYRDGIKWIEFQEGLPLEEVASFFKIAYKYRLFAEETEGDIVTALMDNELEYIDFKAVDIYWQELMLMDLSQLPSPGPSPEAAVDQEETQGARQSTESDDRKSSARSIADPSFTEDQLELSTDDFRILRKMVKEEENWDIKDDLFELLQIILRKQTEQGKFAEVLEFISELTVETIELEKYDLLLKLFQSLDERLLSETPAGQERKRPIIERFFQDLSRPEISNLISKKLLQLKTSDSGHLEVIEKILHYLSPAAIHFLMPVIMQSSSADIKQVVSQVIVRLSRRDLGPLEKMAQQNNQEIGDEFLAILSCLQGKRVNEIFFRLCKHPSNKMRRKTINELLERDSEYTRKLFSLIDDPSDEIRACILAAFQKHKSVSLENLLLNYLQENSAQRDPNHILACFRALGYCGSNRAVPYLHKILLNKGWNRFTGSGKPIFREGAAIALALINTTEANSALQEASKSRFRVIRNAFDKTKHISSFSGKKIND